MEPNSFNQLDSNTLARYLEATGNTHKPWLLAQLRLKKLQETRSHLSPEEYERALADIHASVMNLGEWWVGREAEAFDGETWLD
jgi:hypothetical protein